MHANIGADTRRVTHSLTQFSWCNDPFGTEQHLFSKWRLVLVIFSLTQWAHWEGSILFSTNSQRPVLFRHNALSLLSCHYQVYTVTHIQDQKKCHPQLKLKKWLQQGQKKVKESWTIKKKQEKGKYTSFRMILSVMLLFIISPPFLLFSGEDQGMTACTLCSVIINQETVWREWCQPPAETKPSWVVFFIIRKLGNIYIARPYSSHKGNTVFPAGLFLMTVKHLDSFLFVCLFWKYIPVDCTEVKRLHNN